VNEKLLPQEWPADAVFTRGHSTLPIERFIAVLQTFGIERLVDIRAVPRSGHNPQFNSEALAYALKQENITYVALQVLGGLRRAQKDSPNAGWRNESFRGCADYMQSDEFQEGLKSLIDMSREERVAIMYAEAVPWRCHRWLVADALAIRDIPVVEILPEERYRMHKLTPFARVEDRQITYPAQQESLQ